MVSATVQVCAGVSNSPGVGMVSATVQVWACQQQSSCLQVTVIAHVCGGMVLAIVHVYVCGVSNSLCVCGVSNCPGVGVIAIVQV